MLTSRKWHTLRKLVEKFLEYTREGGVTSALAQVLRFVKREIYHHRDLGVLRLCTPFVVLPGLVEGNADARTKAKSMLYVDIADTTSIQGQYCCLYGAEKIFTGEPCVVVAHWDPQNVVDPYVEYQCRHFKSLGWKVVLVSAAPLQTDEVLERKAEWADAIIYRTCSGYDFTSWKAALDCFPSLYDSQFMVLTNDSYFGPIGDFAPVHEAMAKVDCDFWGMTANHDLAPHLQSYYIVLRAKALQHSALKFFFAAVSLSGCRKNAIMYEVSFTLWLAMHGLHAAVYCAAEEKQHAPVNLTLYHWHALIEKGVPLLKREKFRPTRHNPRPEGWNKTVLSKGYPPMRIAQYFWRIGEDISGTQVSGKMYDAFPPDVLGLQQSVDLCTVLPMVESQPFAVFLHVFYVDVLEEMRKQLQNLPNRAHVYVSTDTEEKKQAIIRLLEPLFFSKLDVCVVPNLGWDIAPFLVGWKSVIPQYELILKIHTKKSTNQQHEFSASWKSLLYSSLFGSKERVQLILAFFEAHPELGMLAPVTHPEISGIESGKCFDHMQRILRGKGIKLPRNAAVDFAVGSMFWARPKILQPLLKLNFSFEDFKNNQKTNRDGSLAHALERLFVWGCGIEKMTWGRVAPVGYERLSPRR